VKSCVSFSGLKWFQHVSICSNSILLNYVILDWSLINQPLMNPILGSPQVSDLWGSSSAAKPIAYTLEQDRNMRNTRKGEESGYNKPFNFLEQTSKSLQHGLKALCYSNTYLRYYSLLVATCCEPYDSPYDLWLVHSTWAIWKLRAQTNSRRHLRGPFQEQRWFKNTLPLHCLGWDHCSHHAVTKCWDWGSSCRQSCLCLFRTLKPLKLCQHCLEAFGEQEKEKDCLWCISFAGTLPITFLRAHFWGAEVAAAADKDKKAKKAPNNFLSIAAESVPFYRLCFFSERPSQTPTTLEPVRPKGTKGNAPLDVNLLEMLFQHHPRSPMQTLNFQCIHRPASARGPLNLKWLQIWKPSMSRQVFEKNQAHETKKLNRCRPIYTVSVSFSICMWTMWRPLAAMSCGVESVSIIADRNYKHAAAMWKIR